VFRPFALPVVAVLLWCAFRAPSAPPTYALPLEPRAEDARDPGPDPDANYGRGLDWRNDVEYDYEVLNLWYLREAVEREWFDEPRFAVPVPRDPLFAERDADEPVRYGFPSPYSNRAFPLNRRAFERAGGDDASARAVARGLAWLARQQHRDGGWACEDDRIAATALALLAFLAHGETHARFDCPDGFYRAHDGRARKQFWESKYQKSVHFGLAFLVQQLAPDGAFRGARSVTSHALATFALGEARAMTGSEWLARPARFARAHLLRAERTGGWSDAPGGALDEFATAWAREALALGPCPGAWSTRNDARRAELPATQHRGEIKLDGSWEPVGGFGARFGRLGTTALNLLTLAAPYRYSPLAP
jgi:hypothetical protein